MTDPTPASSALPPLTAIIVTRNDRETVRAAIDSLLAQNYPSDLDIILALAPNTDGTGDLIAEIVAANPRIAVIDVSSSSLVVGLNEAIAAARTALIIRVDARAVFPPDYAAKAVRAMGRTGAAELIGVTTPVGATPFERAAARGIEHPLGLARDPLAQHAGEAQTQASTAHVIRRRTFIEAGLYDEEIRHGQGWQLSERLRDAGHTVWFSPELQYDYRPPSKTVQLTRSLFAEGLWRGEFARAFPDEKVLRFLLPSIVVIASILGFILGAIGFFGVIAGALGVASVVSLILFALLVLPAAYVLGVVVLAIAAMVRSTVRTGLWFALVLPFIHFSWGFGFIAGFVNLEGAADTVIVDFD
ncbi:glycosyltransferase [Subtercola lobariae]|uniref:Glycosyltransferase 2-like domain-containing protein n=1 Tax=Subtercola lobariae TaxID=1588641 RepID=A0A917B6W5_9MICO|nr:glycosyltransferase [Subtercola lobariae]GGF26487.1 hypothetical protein GCM10011399_19830 [Subtercola lobariae]